ncbi:MAG: NapC/NirT family cytochrome c [Proteobacteria bacterium]|nr:NapC/NirT family cytochrome c [Pseudomonadota bacterium]
MADDNSSLNTDSKPRLFSRKYVLSIFIIFFAGVISFAGFNSILAYTNEMEFCTSCHSMKVNLEEYKETIHYKNSSGVQATCSDCHVPKAFFPKMKAKILAYKDVMHEILGTIDTTEKYEAYRWDMASRVWEKMKANDSRECRSCHDYDNMEFSTQDRSARKKHPRAQLKGQTCIDCHRGIAHEEPDEPDDEEVEATNDK